MSESRVVNYKFNAVELQQIKDTTRPDLVQNALGYLSTWNFTYPTVDIFISHDFTEMTAVYLREDGQRGYVIGAVWNGSSFGFHS